MEHYITYKRSRNSTLHLPSAPIQSVHQNRKWSPTKPFHTTQLNHNQSNWFRYSYRHSKDQFTSHFPLGDQTDRRSGLLSERENGPSTLPATQTAPGWRTNVLLRCRASIMAEITSGSSVFRSPAAFNEGGGGEKVRKKSVRFDTQRCHPSTSIYCIQELLIAFSLNSRMYSNALGTYYKMFVVAGYV